MIKIKAFSPNKIIKLLHKLEINLYNIKIDDNNLYLKIHSNDLAKIKKLYNFEIVKYYGVSYLEHNIVRLLKKYVYLLSIIILIVLFSMFIVKINIKTMDYNLRNKIILYLENKGIKNYTLSKNEKQLLEIKESIMKDLSNDLEWINISHNGMTYDIELQEKVIKEPVEKKEYCKIIAKKDGLITRIVSSSGEVLVKPNDSVKKGDNLISGDIMLNNELKKQVCASGRVFAHTWFNISISIPKQYEKNIYLNKTRYNISVIHNNKNIKIFKNRLSNFITKKNRLVNIFGYEIYLNKDYLIKKEYVKYTEEELEKKIEELVKDKMKKLIGEEGMIIKQNVLKKVDKDSTIDIELFIVAEEEIGESVQ